MHFEQESLSCHLIFANVFGANDILILDMNFNVTKVVIAVLLIYDQHGNTLSFEPRTHHLREV